MPSVRALPLWFRYVFTFAVAAGLFLALVVFVHHHNGPLAESAANPNPSQARQEAIQNFQVAAQQEAPRHAGLARGSTGAAGAAMAITRSFAESVRSGFVPGPLDGPARCSSVIAGRRGRITLACDIFTGSGDNQLRYPFRAVVDASRRRVTFCQIVTPAYPSYPSDTIPVPAGCR